MKIFKIPSEFIPSTSIRTAYNYKSVIFRLFSHTIRPLIIRRVTPLRKRTRLIPYRRSYCRRVTQYTRRKRCEQKNPTPSYPRCRTDNAKKKPRTRELNHTNDMFGNADVKFFSFSNQRWNILRIFATLLTRPRWRMLYTYGPDSAGYSASQFQHDKPSFGSMEKHINKQINRIQPSLIDGNAWRRFGSGRKKIVSSYAAIPELNFYLVWGRVAHIHYSDWQIMLLIFSTI